jgi:hypothetical protein
MDMRPFPAFDALFGRNFAELNMEDEIEEYFANYFFVSTDFPQAGDLMYLNGRWIVDCGHDTYNTEIHPPGVIAITTTAQFVGHPSAHTAIDVNGFFFSENPTLVRLEPPPRPSADARLVVAKTADADSQFGGIQINTAFFFDHVDVTFSGGPTTRPPVTEEGEMKWRAGFAYLGLWDLFWE